MRYLSRRTKTQPARGIPRNSRNSAAKGFASSKLVGFVALIVVSLAIAVISSSVVLSIADAMRCTDEHEYALVEVTVMPGDTLWGIAKEYSGPEVDLRVVVDDIMRENNLSNSIVHPGQVLKLAVPVAYSVQ
jgi:archaellum component FlaG (FlaF/FlaG flagellin family)